MGLLADIDDHQHGGEQGKNRIELDRDAQHHALRPMIRLLGQQIDGRAGHAALCKRGDHAAERHGQARDEILQTLCNGQLGQRTGQQAHAENGEEPHDEAV